MIVGTETVGAFTASGSVISGFPPSTAEIALLAGSIPARATTPVTNISGTTLAAAYMVAGSITRSGPTAAFTDTTDTAANIISALPIGTPLSYTWTLYISNITPYAQTLVAGAGVTINGQSVVPPKSLLIASVAYTTMTTVTITGLAAILNATMNQFGSSAGNFNPEGNLSVQISSSGINPGATGADNVLAAYSIPANAFDQAGRGVEIRAWGDFANTNSKTIKIIVNPSTAVVGSTVGSGGTTIASTGVTALAGGWQISANVYKYGAAGSNTQLGTSNGSIAGTTPLGISVAPQAITATESGAILVAITGNAVTATVDITFNQLVITGQN